MTQARHETHEDHPHQHGPGCGHTAIRHQGHIDYLHDDHLHHQAGGRVEEHRIEASETNPEGCLPEYRCQEGRAGRPHGEAAGEEAGHPRHERVPHGDHMDEIHAGRLHRHHGDHCDDHGPVEIVRET